MAKINKIKLIAYLLVRIEILFAKMVNNLQNKIRNNTPFQNFHSGSERNYYQHLLLSFY